MLETVIIVLLLLWLLGFFAFPIAGGAVHVLIVVVLVLVLIRLLQGQKIL